jgi:hypothetical protein
MASATAEMDTCIPALRRYASALVRDHQEVDDLVHDCLVLALDRLNTFRDDGQLRAWLFAIKTTSLARSVGRGFGEPRCRSKLRTRPCSAGASVRMTKCTSKV